MLVLSCKSDPVLMLKGHEGAQASDESRAKTALGNSPLLPAAGPHWALFFSFMEPDIIF